MIKSCQPDSRLFQHFQAIEYRMEQDIARFLQSLSGRVLVCPGPIFAAVSVAMIG